MKKLIISSAFIIATISLHAQSDNPVFAMNKKEARKERHEQKITLRKLEGKDISTAAKNQFNIDFGNARNVQWSRDLYFDKATFTDPQGNEISAYYDYGAQLVGTLSPRKFSDLPAKARQEIIKHYTNYEKAPVIFYDDNEYNDTDMILYGLQFQDEDNYFIELADKKGRPIVLKVTPGGEVSYFTDMPVKN